MALGDYARVLSRWWTTLVACVLCGIVVGAVLLPRIVARTGRYEASAVVDLRPIRFTDPTQGGSDQKESPQALVPDPGSMAGAITVLGPQAGRLTSVRSRPRPEWAQRLALAVTAAPINGTTQLRVTLRDDDAGLVGAVLDGYLTRYVQRRNTEAERRLEDILASFSGDAGLQQADVAARAAKADAEERAPHGTVSTNTKAALDAAETRLQHTLASMDAVKHQALLDGPPTALMDQVRVAQLDDGLDAKLGAVLGMLLGLLGGIGAAFLLEGYAARIRTARDVEATTGTYVLGPLPSPSPGLAAAEGETPAALKIEDHYHRLAGGLERRGLGGRTKLLVVLAPSHDPAGVAAAITVNLGQALASEGEDTLLVSAGRRDQQVETRLGLTASTAGLATFLADGHLSPVELALPIAEHLTLLPAGDSTVNPARLLSARQAERLVRQLREAGTTTLIHTPPLNSAPEALTLAHGADATLLVVPAYTTVRDVREATRILQQEGIPILSAVLVESPGRRPLPSRWLHTVPLPHRRPRAADLPLPWR